MGRLGLGEGAAFVPSGVLMHRQRLPPGQVALMGSTCPFSDLKEAPFVLHSRTNSGAVNRTPAAFDKKPPAPRSSFWSHIVMVAEK